MTRLVLHHGDCVHVLRGYADGSIGAIVSDPPYGLSFMGKDFDKLGEGSAQREWHRNWLTEAFRVLRPGGVIKAFSGSRTFHHLAYAVKQAGFVNVGMEAWTYGSGFPKSLDIGKAMDRRGGKDISWFGPWFRAWRDEHKVNQRQVSALFPSKAGSLTGCVANWELGYGIPTPEQFNLIRDTFGLPFASIEVAEREIVGTQHRASTGRGNQGEGGYAYGEDFNITAPATDAAKAWAGWGTALKPAWEPVVTGRKPA